MRITDFDYELADELIARYPAAERRDSRLLCLHPATEEIKDREFRDLPSLINPGDLLVLNDTRVIPARLFGHKESGGKVELLIERILGQRSALAMIKASKTPKPGSRLLLNGAAEAVVGDRQFDLFMLEFSTDIEAHLHAFGEVPLPPYLGRDADATDRDRYQCVYASESGAAAAPTAGLHFDDSMLQELDEMGVRSCFVTLHVGAGTFQSLREENLESNLLHSERVFVSRQVCDAVEDCRGRGGRVIAVGTTSVRALESASVNGELRPVDGETELFIYPGHTFTAVDALLTNFHLPQSSLLMLVAAFAGTEFVLRAYQHAVHARYRFFSYGDAMLITNHHEI
jgi:S-adenosylmethionine:tRNA ribosyltransferase-isomerase